MRPRHPHLGERGATLVEYALIVALLCIVIIGAAQAFEDGAEDRYDERAEQGDPSEEFGNLGPTDGGSTGGTTDDGTTDGEPDVGVTAITVQPLTATGPRVGNNDWSMTVTVTVLGDGQPLAGVVFSPSSWSPAVSGSTTSCTTTATGVCTFTQSPMSTNGNPAILSATFTLGTPSFTNPEGQPPPTIAVSSTSINCTIVKNSGQPATCA